MHAGWDLSRELLTNRVQPHRQTLQLGASVDDGLVLGATWQSLLAGEAKIVDTFWTADRLGATFVSPPLDSLPTPLEARQAAILEEVLLDSAAKTAAINWN